MMEGGSMGKKSPETKAFSGSKPSAPMVGTRPQSKKGVNVQPKLKPGR